MQNIQLKLKNNNQTEMSAWLDLTSYGINIKSPVYVSGTIQTNHNRLQLKINSAKLGLLPVMDKYLVQGEEKLNQLVNQQLSRIPNLTIEKLEINNGRLHYQGIFHALFLGNK